MATCKEKQEAEREKNKFLMRKQLTDSSSMEAWLQAKKQAQSKYLIIPIIHQRGGRGLLAECTCVSFQSNRSLTLIISS